MAGLNILTLGSGKSYANMVALGISNMRTSGSTVYFTVAATGEEVSVTLPVPADGKDGISVTGVSDKGNGIFTLLFSDGSESDPIQCVNGSDGFSPTATVEKVGKVATITITDKNGTTTATIKDGEGSEGGEANIIDSISVNGVNVSPDVNKNVDITVPSIEGLTKDADLATVAKSGSYEDLSNKPTIPSLDGYAKTTEIPSKVSELENDSNYLSSIPEEYVTETELSAKGYLTEHQDISGKVDKVEGKSLISDTEIARLATVDNYDDTDIKAEIAKKADATAVPSKVSELTNDSNYQTAEQVNSTVTTEIAKVVADAPEDLNTLKEMSDWIAGHEDDATAMNSAITDNKNAITALQTGKADKSEIPSLTGYAKTSDLHSHTNKTVLDGITSTKVSNWDSAKTHADSAHAPSNAQANVIETVKVNGSALSVSDKAVDVTVPTKVSELNNDSGFITIDDTQSSATTTYSSSKIDTELNKRRITYNKQWYGSHDKYVKLGSIPISTGTVSYASLLVNLFASSLNSNLYPIGTINLNISSGSIASTFNINGFSTIVLNVPRTGSGVNTPHIVVDKTSTHYVLYIDCSYNYLRISCSILTGQNFTFGDFEDVSDLEGTEIWSSVTSDDIKYLGGMAKLDDTSTSTTTTYSSSKIASELGGTDISAIGDGTVTGAISTINTSLANYSIPLNISMGTNHYLAIKVNVHDMNYYFNMSDRSGNIYEGSFFLYNNSFSVQITKINNSLTKIGYILGFRQYKVSTTEVYLVAKVSDYNCINGVINTSSALKSNIEIIVNDDSTLWDSGTDIVVKELATIDTFADYTKNIKIGKTENIDANNWVANNVNYIFPEFYEGNTSNMPSWNKTGGGQLECKSWGNYVTQVFYPYGSGTSRVYMRSRHLDTIYKWTDWTELVTTDKLGGLTFSVSGTTLSITDGTHTWTLEANS